MAGQVTSSFDTASLGALNDVQLDYYGKRVAAASSDNTVHIWDITDGQQRPVAQLKAHEGPVWKVSWAHPKFGSLMASVSYDMKIIIWKEVQLGNWQIAAMDTSHTSSVNDVKFCPWESGLRVACASSDGTVSVLTHQAHDHQWRRSVFQAHGGGAQSVSWAPAKEGSTAMRLVTGGCDNRVSIWKCDGDVWTQDAFPLPGAHNDWVRDVAWRPDASGASVVASGSWDKTVVIWKQETEGQPWRQACRIPMTAKVEGLSWSATGSILSVSFGESEAVLYKEAYDGQYVEVGRCSEPGYVEVPHNLGGPGGAGMPPSPKPACAVMENVAANIAPAAAAAPPSEFAQQQQSVLDSFGC